VLFLGGAVVDAQEAAAAPSSADSKPATDAEFIAAADEVLGQMSQITDLKLLKPLKKSLRSREEIRAYVIKQMNEDKNAAERYADQRSAEAFGLLPKGFRSEERRVGKECRARWSPQQEKKQRQVEGLGK